MKRIGPFFVRGRARKRPVDRIQPLDERDQRLLDLHRRERAARGIDDGERRS